MGSPNLRIDESQSSPPKVEEEAWFADRGRESKRP